MLFFLSLAFFFYGKAIQERRRVQWIAFGIFSSLAFWTHFYVLLIVVLLFLFSPYLMDSLKTGINGMKDILVGLLIFLLVSLPLIFVMAHLFIIRISSTPTYGVQGLDVIRSSLIALAGYDAVSLSVSAILFFVGIFFLFFKNRKLSVLILGTIIITFLISIFLSTRMPMEPRYLIVLLPFFLLCIGYSTCMFSKYAQKEIVILVLVVIAILINVPSLQIYYSNYTYDDLRTLSAQIGKETQQNDIIILMPAYMLHPFNYYYHSKDFGTIVKGASSTDDLIKILSKKGNSKIFYIISEENLHAADPNLETVKWLNNRSQSMGRFMGYLILVSA